MAPATNGPDRGCCWKAVGVIEPRRRCGASISPRHPGGRRKRGFSLRTLSRMPGFLAVSAGSSFFAPGPIEMPSMLPWRSMFSSPARTKTLTGSFARAGGKAECCGGPDANAAPTNKMTRLMVCFMASFPSCFCVIALVRACPGKHPGLTARHGNPRGDTAVLHHALAGGARYIADRRVGHAAVPPISTS